MLPTVCSGRVWPNGKIQAQSKRRLLGDADGAEFVELLDFGGGEGAGCGMALPDLTISAILTLATKRRATGAALDVATNNQSVSCPPDARRCYIASEMCLKLR